MSGVATTADAVMRSTGVVVLNWKDAARTVVLVRSLLADFCPEHVVVSDNESDGSLRSALDDAGAAAVTVLARDDNVGFAAGVNPGLAWVLSHGLEHALVLNNDLRYERGGLLPLFEDVARRPLRGVAAPLLLDVDGGLQGAGGRVEPWTLRVDDTAAAAGRDVEFLSWACVLVDRSTLQTVGLLDESYFMYWEDVDHSLRVTAAGRELRLVTTARIVHERSVSHGRAGSSISRYQASGSVRYALSRGGAAYVGIVVRTALRIGRRLADRDLTAVREVLRGTASGWRAHLTRAGAGARRREGDLTR
ncbi:glycosyltransferase family 2 protein [Cellulomonas fimi]|uniref:glycosyltransferase family 2 protein n=1 Tax=Cellulomonas fimi TaxID=1708 RepID=UPI00234CEC80|nr:glycosyltransferase family 2 protein [Cellulomonas fimi]MDC7121641.1 glycosyltransferase family 2 protein [Cellulomonas fimi]